MFILLLTVKSAGYPTPVQYPSCTQTQNYGPSLTQSQASQSDPEKDSLKAENRFLRDEIDRLRTLLTQNDAEISNLTTKCTRLSQENDSLRQSKALQSSPFSTQYPTPQAALQASPSCPVPQPSSFVRAFTPQQYAPTHSAPPPPSAPQQYPPACAVPSQPVAPVYTAPAHPYDGHQTPKRYNAGQYAFWANPDHQQEPFVELERAQVFAILGMQDHGDTHPKNYYCDPKILRQEYPFLEITQFASRVNQSPLQVINDFYAGDRNGKRRFFFAQKVQPKEGVLQAMDSTVYCMAFTGHASGQYLPSTYFLPSSCTVINHTNCEGLNFDLHGTVQGFAHPILLGGLGSQREMWNITPPECIDTAIEVGGRHTVHVQIGKGVTILAINLKGYLEENRDKNLLLLIHANTIAGSNPIPSRFIRALDIQTIENLKNKTRTEAQTFLRDFFRDRSIISNIYARPESIPCILPTSSVCSAHGPNCTYMNRPGGCRDNTRQSGAVSSQAPSVCSAHGPNCRYMNRRGGCRNNKNTPLFQ